MLSEVIKIILFWEYKHISKASGILAQDWPQKSSVKFGKISLGGHAQLNIKNMSPPPHFLVAVSASVEYCKNIVSTTSALSKALQFNSSLMCLSLAHIGKGINTALHSLTTSPCFFQ